MDPLLVPVPLWRGIPAGPPMLLVEASSTEAWGPPGLAHKQRRRRWRSGVLKLPEDGSSGVRVSSSEDGSSGVRVSSSGSSSSKRRLRTKSSPDEFVVHQNKRRRVGHGASFDDHGADFEDHGHGAGFEDDMASLEYNDHRAGFEDHGTGFDGHGADFDHTPSFEYDEDHEEKFIIGTGLKHVLDDVDYDED